MDAIKLSLFMTTNIIIHNYLLLKIVMTFNEKRLGVVS